MTVAVPTAEEAKALFGIPLSKREIQPVWVEVRNGTDDAVRFAPVGLDSDYFPPFEVAYIFRKGFSKPAQREIETRLFELSMGRRIESGETRSGSRIRRATQLPSGRYARTCAPLTRACQASGNPGSPCPPTVSASTS